MFITISLINPLDQTGIVVLYTIPQINEIRNNNRARAVNPPSLCPFKYRKKRTLGNFDSTDHFLRQLADSLLPSIILALWYTSARRGIPGVGL